MLTIERIRSYLKKQPRERLTMVAAAATTFSIVVRWMRRRALENPIIFTPVSELLKAVEAGRVRGAVVTLGACGYSLVSGENCQTTLLPADAKLLVSLLHRHSVPYRAQGPPSWRAALVLIVPIAYLGVCGWLLHRMTSDNGLLGGGPDPTANASNKGSAEDAVASVGWDDVAGLPGIKSAVMEVVDVMQRPEHYARLGARCPRGVLLAGPPGTGKTLLARAVASEAGVPFLSCTGSDFVEVFVGRGARRVRSLFEEASRRSPCVLFIDELDALGASRSARGGGGGSEEHDQTLNQLLALMDGMASNQGVLVMAATNRLAALDPALTRPGRFDRVLQLALPDEAARLAILKVHAARTALEGERPEHERVLKKVAKQTVGFSGAELANIINEAAISAVREGDALVRSRHLEQAVAGFKSARGRGPSQPTNEAGGSGDGGGPQGLQPAMEVMQELMRMGLQVGPPMRPQPRSGTASVIEENE